MNDGKSEAYYHGRSDSLQKVVTGNSAKKRKTLLSVQTGQYRER
jgi:hypothetical protein